MSVFVSDEKVCLHRQPNSDLFQQILTNHVRSLSELIRLVKRPISGTKKDLNQVACVDTAFSARQELTKPVRPGGLPRTRFKAQLISTTLQGKKTACLVLGVRA